jgi:hypothetical protein
MTNQDRRKLRGLLNVAVAAMLAGALVVPMVTHDAPKGGWLGFDATTEPLPVNAP